MSISLNIQKIHNEVEKRTKGEVKLVCVTKNRSVDEIKQAISAGITVLGENRVQEAEKKFPFIPAQIEKHFIGHLQSNKVKKAVRLFDIIQSVDSLKLAIEINKEAEKAGKSMKIMLQVNISNDPNKYGFKKDEIQQSLIDISALQSIKIIGLMTILELTDNNDKIRAYFREMKALFNSCKTLSLLNLELKHLSMGMSDDYQIALEEGSNMIRVGRAVFAHPPIHIPPPL